MRYNSGTILTGMNLNKEPVRTIKDFLVENDALDLYRSFCQNKTEKEWENFLSTPIFDEAFERKLKSTLQLFLKLDIQRSICHTILGIVENCRKK